jgi:hypothetical protein
MNDYRGTPFGDEPPKDMSHITKSMITQIVERLSVGERVHLGARGYVFLQMVRFEGRRREVPLYLFRCAAHGYEVNYPAGYESKLICLECLREESRKRLQQAEEIQEEHLPEIGDEEEGLLVDDQSPHLETPLSEH